MKAEGMIDNPLVYWFGGKFAMSDWIISFFPAHRCYVDIFGGGGSVLLKKPRSHKEIYNDLNGDAVNLMRAVRDDWEELQRRLRLTLWSREEFERAVLDPPTDDPVERARRTIVASWMSRVNGGVDARATGYRSTSALCHRPQEKVFPKMVDHLHEYAERLRGVEIESMDAIKLAEKHMDDPSALIYADPPYMHGERRSQARYRFEYTEDDHARLLDALRGARCSVVVSGYDSGLYRERLAGWRRETRTVKTLSGRNNAVECIWMNFGAENSLF